MNKAIFYDFDGVILDSFGIKTEAFREVLSDYPEAKVEELIKYHKEHGGISRHIKFKYFFEELMGITLSESEIDDWDDRFSSISFDNVIAAPYIDGVQTFIKNHFQEYDSYIVSGTPQRELKKVVEVLNIGHYFKGIFGSPKTKVEIVNSILKEGSYNTEECYFFGDAKTDYLAAKETGVNFILVESPENKNLRESVDTSIKNFLNFKL